MQLLPSSWHILYSYEVFFVLSAIYFKWIVLNSDTSFLYPRQSLHREISNRNLNKIYCFILLLFLFFALPPISWLLLSNGLTPHPPRSVTALLTLASYQTTVFCKCTSSHLLCLYGLVESTALCWYCCIALVDMFSRFHAVSQKPLCVMWWEKFPSSGWQNDREFV